MTTFKLQLSQQVLRLTFQVKQSTTRSLYSRKLRTQYFCRNIKSPLTRQWIKSHIYLRRLFGKFLSVFWFLILSITVRKLPLITAASDTPGWIKEKKNKNNNTVCIAGNFCLEKIFAYFTPCSHVHVKFYPTIVCPIL